MLVVSSNLSNQARVLIQDSVSNLQGLTRAILVLLKGVHADRHIRRSASLQVISRLALRVQVISVELVCPAIGRLVAVNRVAVHQKFKLLLLEEPWHMAAVWTYNQQVVRVIKLVIVKVIIAQKVGGDCIRV